MGRQATCIEDRVDIYGCSMCKATEERVAAGTKTGHDYAVWEVYEEADCTKNAKERSVCTVCGNVGYREAEKSRLPHNYGTDDKCTGCGKGKPPYTIDGDVVYFGSYPQTQITSSLKDDLTRAATREFGMPSTKQHIGWTVFGSNLLYKDLEYGGSKYRGIIFENYRPLNGRGGSAVSTGWQEKNGYKTNIMYWFRFEPVKWRILKEADGKAMLMANIILDSEPFDNYTAYNNYAESYIRNWLNQNFYNDAFALEEKNIIVKTTVDNSLATTCDEINPNVCADTEDYIFLLSKYEAKLYFSDADSRFLQATDYAKAFGLAVDDDNCGYWWMRSPEATESKEYVYLGIPTKYYDRWIGIGTNSDTNTGVVPVTWIEL